MNVSSRVAYAKSASKSCRIKSKESKESRLERLESAQAFFIAATVQSVAVGTAGNRASADSTLLQSILQSADCCCTITFTVLAFFALLIMFNGFIGASTTSVGDDRQTGIGTTVFALDFFTIFSGLVGGRLYTIGFTGISTGGRGDFMYIEFTDEMDSNSITFAIQSWDRFVGISQRVSDMSSGNTEGLLGQESVVSVQLTESEGSGMYYSK